MSENLCILIPSKTLSVDKYFSKKLLDWLATKIDENLIGESLFVEFLEFRERKDVNLNIPNELSRKYHVLDLKFFKPKAQDFQSLLALVAKSYPYGQVGLLIYWEDSRKRYPPVTLAENNPTLKIETIDKLELDKLYFTSLSNYK